MAEVTVPDEVLASMQKALTLMTNQLEEHQKHREGEWTRMVVGALLVAALSGVGWLVIGTLNSPSERIHQQEATIREHESTLSAFRERMMKQETTLGHIQDATVQNSVEIRETRRLLEQMIQQQSDHSSRR